MENMSNIGNLFALSHDPVVCVEDGQITYMNPPAIALFRQDMTGMSEYAILPAHLLDITPDEFVASATIHGNIVTISRTGYLKQRLYSFILPNKKEENDAIQAVSSTMRELTNGIKITADLITSFSVECQDQRLQQYSAILKHFSAKMKRLVNNYALFSAFKQGAQPFNPTMASIGDVCQEICEEVEAFTLPHNITMTYASDKDLFACVDQPLLSQMLLNLICNSLNHMPDGGCIHIESRCINGYIVISVEDNGTGIPTDVLANVFHGYAQQSDLSAGNFNAGLGLSVADAVAKLHGGTLIIQSNEKTGTKVMAQFPRVVDNKFMSSKVEYRVPMHEFIMTDLSTWLTWEDYISFENKKKKKEGM